MNSISQKMTMNRLAGVCCVAAMMICTNVGVASEEATRQYHASLVARYPVTMTKGMTRVEDKRSFWMSVPEAVLSINGTFRATLKIESKEALHGFTGVASFVFKDARGNIVAIRHTPEYAVAGPWLPGPHRKNEAFEASLSVKECLAIHSISAELRRNTKFHGVTRPGLLDELIKEVEDLGVDIDLLLKLLLGTD